MEGGRIRSIYYEVFLPILLDAWNSSYFGGNNPGNRKDDAGYGRVFVFALHFPGFVDLGSDVRIT